jgi:hypothetical protein
MVGRSEVRLSASAGKRVCVCICRRFVRVKDKMSKRRSGNEHFAPPRYNLGGFFICIADVKENRDEYNKISVR